MKILEKVTDDCQTGSGVMFKMNGWVIERTKHLDDIRPPGQKQRDDGFYCNKFRKILEMFFGKRPLGFSDGLYNLVYKDEYGFQNCVINVKNGPKKIVFITIMQLNKRNITDYKLKNGDHRIYIGKIKGGNSMLKEILENVGKFEKGLEQVKQELKREKNEIPTRNELEKISKKVAGKLNLDVESFVKYIETKIDMKLKVGK